MANTKLVSQVVFGGNAVNNPVPFSIANFNLSALELTFVYQQRNVIAFHNRLQVNMEVTALVRVDTFGNPMVDDDDLVYLPCPPYCQRND